MVNTTPLYSYESLENATGLKELFGFIDVSVGGLYIPLLLLAFFLIAYFGLSNYMDEKAFLAAGYSTSLIALLFWAAGLTHSGWAFTLFLLTSVVTLVVRTRR